MLRIWRLELYKVKNHTKDPLPWFSFHFGGCRCVLVSVKGVGVTWLSNDCRKGSTDESSVP